MKILRSTNFKNDGGEFVCRNVENAYQKEVSAEVADVKMDELDAKTSETMTRAERQSQRRFEKSVEKLQKKLDRERVDTGELEEISTVINAEIATPDQKNLAERALRQIPVEDVLRWGKRGSHAETLRQIFLTNGEIDLHDVEISTAQKSQFEQVLGVPFPVEKKEQSSDQKKEQTSETYGGFAKDFEKWISDGMKVAELAGLSNWMKFPASLFLKQTPEVLRKAFVVDGKVNFHGNNKAERYIGLGDLYTQEQAFLKVGDEIGKRSFSGSKIGYLDVNGRYLSVFGGESVEGISKESIAEKEVSVETGAKTVKENLPTTDGLSGFENIQPAKDEQVIKEQFYTEVHNEEVREQEKIEATNKWLAENGLEGIDALSSREIFAAYTKKVAQQIEKDFGIPWQVTAAQGALESGDGQSRLSQKYNNMFGYKDFSKKGANMDTEENYDGKGNQTVKDQYFRTYSTPAESFLDYAELISTAPRYRNILTAYKKGGTYEIPEDYRKESDGWDRENKISKGTPESYWIRDIKSPEDVLWAIIASGYATHETDDYVGLAMAKVPKIDRYGTSEVAYA